MENKSKQTKHMNSKINTKRITLPKTTQVNRVASAKETKHSKHARLQYSSISNTGSQAEP